MKIHAHPKTCTWGHWERLRQKEKWAAEDEMVRQHHQLTGHDLNKFQETLEDRGAWCSTVHWITKLDTTKQINYSNKIWRIVLGMQDKTSYFTKFCGSFASTWKIKLCFSNSLMVDWSQQSHYFQNRYLVAD